MRSVLPFWVYLSLGLNILLLGFVLGGLLLRPPFPMPMMAMKDVLDKMPEHGRNLVKETFMDLKKWHDSKEADMKSVRAALADAVAAPQLDMTAIDNAEKQMRSNALDMMENGSARMRKLLQQLTPEERAIIANNLRNAGPQMPPIP